MNRRTGTIARTYLDVDDRVYVLDPGQESPELMERIEQAARSSGGFVHFTTAGLAVSVLISPSTRVVVTTDTAFSGEPATDLSEYARRDWGD